MTQSIEEQIGAVPAIKPKFHFFQVGRKMFGTDSVPRSHNAALEQRESRFDGISVNVPHDVHAGTVVDSPVILAASLPHCGDIGHMVVSENYLDILTDILSDIFGERTRLRIVGMEESQIAITFADADYDFFILHAIGATLPQRSTADIGHIHLNLAVKHGFIGLRHGMADAVTEIPCRFVSADSKRALNLAGGHTLLRFAEEKCCSKPRRQWQVRIIENCSSGDGELIVTVFAIEELLFGFQFDHRAFAAQAAWTFREAQARQEFAALGIGREEGVYVH